MNIEKRLDVATVTVGEDDVVWIREII